MRRRHKHHNQVRCQLRAQIKTRAAWSDVTHEWAADPRVGTFYTQRDGRQAGCHQLKPALLIHNHSGELMQTCLHAEFWRIKKVPTGRGPGKDGVTADPGFVIFPKPTRIHSVKDADR